jgi:hypothetical protein
MFPELENPLTDAYLAGARARTHNEMMAAIKLAKHLEARENPQIIAACQLAAEYILDRRHGANHALRVSE